MSGGLRMALRGDGERGYFLDFALDGTDFARDDGLETAVLLSLFTDARAPAGTPGVRDDDRRGWWGNLVPPAQAVASGKPWQLGSLLWTLSREKQTLETARRAKQFSEDALAWMLDDGLAKVVTVDAVWLAPPRYPQGTLALRERIERPDGTFSRYAQAWAAQANRLLSPEVAA